MCRMSGVVLSLLLVFSSISFTSSTHCYATKMKGSYFKSERIASGTNQTLAIATSTETKYSRCVNKCSKMTSIASLYFDEATGACQCNNQTDKQRVPGTDSDAVRYAYVTRITLSTPVASCGHVNCEGLHATGYRAIAWYEFQYPDSSASTSIHCNLAEEWTVFQTRFDGSVDFNRSWTDYVNGFGSRPGGEFWLGLDAIHSLTVGRSCELMVVLEVAGENDPRNANYSSFSVGSAATDYTLHVAGFSGIGLVDRLAYHNGSLFTTYDNDNDNYPNGNCASLYWAGWWYNCCASAQLNAYPIRWPGVSGISKSAMKFRCM